MIPLLLSIDKVLDVRLCVCAGPAFSSGAFWEKTAAIPQLQLVGAWTMLLHVQCVSVCLCLCLGMGMGMVMCMCMCVVVVVVVVGKVRRNSSGGSKRH